MLRKNLLTLVALGAFLLMPKINAADANGEDDNLPVVIVHNFHPCFLTDLIGEMLKAATRSMVRAKYGLQKASEIVNIFYDSDDDSMFTESIWTRGRGLRALQGKTTQEMFELVKPCSANTSKADDDDIFLRKYATPPSTSPVSTICADDRSGSSSSSVGYPHDSSAASVSSTPQHCPQEVISTDSSAGLPPPLQLPSSSTPLPKQETDTFPDES